MQRGLNGTVVYYKKSLGKTQKTKFQNEGKIQKEQKPTEKTKVQNVIPKGQIQVGNPEGRQAVKTQGINNHFQYKTSFGQSTNVAQQRLSTEHRQKQGLYAWLDWSCDRSNKTQVTGLIGKAREQKILK